MRAPFDRAVEAHGAAVLRVCRHVLGNVHDADDAWQETFLAALRAWPNLDEGANVEAWLVTIARRRSIDIARARSRRAIPVADVPEIVPWEEEGADHDWVLRAVAELPDRQRRAVTHHHLGGLPHAEVAALIGGSPESVRRASADGMAALRKRFTSRSVKEEK